MVVEIASFQRRRITIHMIRHSGGDGTPLLRGNPTVDIRNSWHFENTLLHTIFRNI